MTSDRGFEIDLDGMRQLDGGEAAVGVFRRVAEDHVLALHRATHEPPSAADVPDHRRTISDDFAVRLSDTELQQMRLELAELLDRWTDTSRALNDVDDGVERQAYYGVVMAALVPGHQRHHARTSEGPAAMTHTDLSTRDSPDYDDFAATYAGANDNGLFNAWYARPEMLRLVGDVAGDGPWTRAVAMAR